MPLNKFKADYLLLDMNNLCLRLWWAMQNLDYAVPFGFLKQVQTWSAGKYDVSKIVAIWDGPPYFRKSFYPEHKQKDTKSDMDWETYYEQVDIVLEFLDCLSIPSIKRKSFEADDLVGLITYLASLDRKSVLILSEDRDLSQFLVWKNSTLICPVSEVQFSGPRVVIRRADMEVDEVVLFKALSGDSSDNIKGIPGIGPVRALNLIREIKPFEKQELEKSDNKWAKVVLENWDIFSRNMALVNIVDSSETTGQMFHKKGISTDELIRRLAGNQTNKFKVKKAKFKQLIKEYQFLSLIASTEQILTYCRKVGGV